MNPAPRQAAGYLTTVVARFYSIFRLPSIVKGSLLPSPIPCFASILSVFFVQICSSLNFEEPFLRSESKNAFDKKNIFELRSGSSSVSFVKFLSGLTSEDRFLRSSMRKPLSEGESPSSPMQASRYQVKKNKGNNVWICSFL